MHIFDYKFYFELTKAVYKQNYRMHLNERKKHRNRTTQARTEITALSLL